ncbi:hypothetical protein DFJ77DRAFT_506244 [Powellomyces hirtus]|nr:hypothetical protein DFJ77DRAFT_506244 [Powellomyces hirtus]
MMGRAEFDHDAADVELDNAAKVTGIIVCILCSITIAGNTFIFRMATKRKALQTIQNALLLYMCAADWCICVARFIFTAGALISQGYRWGTLGCEIDGFLTVFFNHISISSYAAIGLERYLRIAKQKTLTWRHICGMILASLTWAVFSTTSTYWTDKAMVHHALQPSRIYCTLGWWSSVYFTQMSCLATVVGTLSIFAISYWRMCVELHNQASKWQGESLNTSDEAFDYSFLNTEKPQYHRLVMEKSVLLVLTFIANWGLYAFIMLYSISSGKSVPPAVDCIGIVMVINNPVCTFMYTMLLDKRWKRAARDTLGIKTPTPDLEKTLEAVDQPMASAPETATDLMSVMAEDEKRRMFRSRP